MRKIGVDHNNHGHMTVSAFSRKFNLLQLVPSVFKPAIDRPSSCSPIDLLQWRLNSLSMRRFTGSQIDKQDFRWGCR